MDRSRIMRTVVTALFTALVAAGAFIRIPMVPVPMTLQTFFALVAAACLPPTMATVSMLVYLFLGTVGLPIFTAGGGLAALLGPTGGYLIGLVPAVLAGSLVMKTSSSIGTSRRHERACISVRAAMAFGKSWSVVHRDHCGRTAAVHRGGCRQVCRDRRCRSVREGPCDGSRLEG